MDRKLSNDYSLTKKQPAEDALKSYPPCHPLAVRLMIQTLEFA